MARKINGITIAIDADTNGVTSGLKDLTTESISLSKQLKSVDQLLKMDPGNTDLIRQKYELLDKAVDTSRKKLDALKGAQSDVEAAFARGDIGTDEYIAFQREIITTEKRLKDLEKQADGTGTETKELATDTKSAGTEMEKTEKESGKLGNALKEGIAKGAEAAKAAIEATIEAIGAASKAILDFAKDSVQTGMEFDSAVSQIGATMGYTAAEMNDSTTEAAKNMDLLREKAIQMGSETSFTATEAAEGLNILAMSGYDAAEATAMIDDVLDLAAAGTLGLAESAKYVAGAMKGFADETKDSQYYADLMAKGATLAATDVNALGDALSGSAATAASYGQSADGVTVALLRLAEQGSTGSEAATMMSRAMADLYTATDTAQAKLDELGVNVYDARGNARDFNTVVAELDQSLSKMSEEEANATKNAIFTTNGLKAFNKMTVTSTETVDEWSEALANASGSAANQAKAMLDNLSGDITIFGSALDGAKIALSDALTPALRDFVQFGTEGVSTLTEAFKEGGLSGALDAAAPILDELVKRISDLVPDILKVITTVINSISRQLPTLIRSILPALIGSVKGVLNMLVQQLPQIFRVISDAMPLLVDAITTILPNLVIAGMDILTALVQGIADALPTMIPQIVDVVLHIADILTSPDTLGVLLDASFAIIDALIDGLLSEESINKFVTELPIVIVNIVNALIDSVDKLLEAASKIITALCDYFSKPQNIEKLKEAASKILTSLGKALKDMVGNLIPFMQDIAQAWAEMFIGDIDYDDTAYEVLRRLGEAFAHNFTHSFSNLGEWIGETAADVQHSIFGGTNEHFATGGIVRSPTRAMIGENGAELILPLENNVGWMDQLAMRLNAVGGLRIGSINVNVTGTREIGHEVVAQIDTALRQYQIQQQRGTGGTGW